MPSIADVHVRAQFFLSFTAEASKLCNAYANSLLVMQVTRDALLKNHNMKETGLKSNTAFGSGYPGGDIHYLFSSLLRMCAAHF